MSAAKTHRLTLDNGHTEDVTDKGLADIKSSTGRNFSLYKAEPIQPPKPDDVVAPAKDKDKAKDATKPE